MIETSILTWVLAIFGAISFLPLMAVQFLMVLYPNRQTTKDLIIAKGEDWRDKTHFKSILGFAWADLLVIFPLLILSYIGVFTGQLWGYLIWFTLGILSIYFSIVFWVMEKKYSYPSIGWLAYYTYAWGFFLYWGIAATILSLLKII